MSHNDGIVRELDHLILDSLCGKKLERILRTLIVFIFGDNFDNFENLLRKC